MRLVDDNAAPLPPAPQQPAFGSQGRRRRPASIFDRATNAQPASPLRRPPGVLHCPQGAALSARPPAADRPARLGGGASRVPARHAR